MRAAETKEGTCAGAAQENAEGSAAERNDQQVAPAMRQLQESSKKQFVAGYETSGNSRRAATHPRLSISGDVDLFVRRKENFDEIKKMTSRRLNFDLDGIFIQRGGLMDIADPYVSRVIRCASDLVMSARLENDSGEPASRPGGGAQEARQGNNEELEKQFEEPSLQAWGAHGGLRYAVWALARGAKKFCPDLKVGVNATWMLAFRFKTATLKKYDPMRWAKLKELVAPSS